jgi:hypothetical protein
MGGWQEENQRPHNPVRFSFCNLRGSAHSFSRCVGGARTL